jgi:peptide/nickel transport system substrate-binding protein
MKINIHILVLILKCTIVTTAFLAFTGCGSSESISTPSQPAPAAAPAVPAAAPAASVVVIADAPTPIPARATSTRVLPTATVPITLSRLGGVVRHARNLDMQVLSPLHNKSAGEQDPVFAIFDSLTYMESDFTITPGLARSWEYSNGGKDITFHLAKGVKYHDGTAFSAQDVKWTIDKVLDPDFFSTSVGFFSAATDSLEVVDDNTVILHLKKAWRPLLANMSTAKFGFLSPTAYAKDPENYGRYPSGTGPYKLKEWVPDVRIVMERNEAFWDKDFFAGQPYLDEVWLQNVPDATVQLAMLRTGEAEILDGVSGTELPLIENNPDIKIVPFETRNWWSMFMQIKNAPFDNLALRQAILYSIDRETLVDVHLNGLGKAAYTNGNFYYSDETYEPYKFDAAKAKAKLIEAGYPDGVTIPYSCYSNDIEIRLCEIISSFLSDTGITTEIKLVPSTDYWKNINSGDCKFCKMAYFPRPDPDYVMRATLHYKGFRGRNVHGTDGVSKYPEVDKLIDEAAGEYDTSKAGAMYVKAQKIVFDDAAYTGLYYPTVYAAMLNKVQGYQWWTDSRIRYRTMWIKE